jgi:hypothetical protein
MHADNFLSPKLKPATSQTNYGAPIKKKAAIITSAFSSPKQLEKNYASPIATASPHPWDTKQTVATDEMMVASSEDSNVLPTIDVQNKDVTLCAAISSSPEKQVRHPSCDIVSQLQIDDSNDASDGLSMMAREVHSDGAIVDVKGQRSSIFQTACKIQDKVCKVIIDGGSFTNAISSDVVHALSLSTRRFPTPRYMQWINQSGMLKITHKVRVKFSIGNYVDTIDCDVAPMSACHLLLGRPWQFDLDATHGGRSNNYSFVHKGVHHLLESMPDNAIKAEVFSTVKMKKKAPEIIPKPRTALLREGENGVNIPTVNIDVSESAVNCTEPIKPAIQFGSISDNIEKNGTSVLAPLYAADNSNIPNNAKKG